MLIDTHTHLESFARKGILPETLARAKDAGVEAMISVGTSPDDWELYRGLAKLNPGLVHYTVGLHPCAVEEEWQRAVEQMDAFWAAGDASNGGAALAIAHGPRPIALGEIGLDRFHLPKDAADAERTIGWQREAFAVGLKKAKALGCPVVVHSRNAFQECVEMIDASGVDWQKVVFHCFTEGEREMRELLARGGRGSFTGIVTYKSATNVREAAKALGLERMMVETDAPYLTPMPHRGKPNEPAYVRHTAEFLATDVFGISYDDFAKATTANARQFFGI
jgi:TatD DNase family protein